MINLKSTLRLESQSALPSGLNLTVIDTSSVTNSNLSAISVDTNLIDLPISGNGPKGSILYVQSPITNQNVINIYGKGQTIPFITLKPGEFAIVPLSSLHDGLQVNCPFGTASLNHLFASKGGQFGKSTVLLKKEVDYWYYGVFDYDLGQVRNWVSTGIDSSINFSYYNEINNSGMAVHFQAISGDKYTIFINSRGKLVTPPFTNPITLLNYDNLNGKGALTIWSNSGTLTATLFDGDEFYTHDFPGASDLYLDDNWDNCTADGAFVLYVSDYEGQSSIDAEFLINKGVATKLNELNYGSSYLYSNAYFYNFGTFVYVEIYNDDTGHYEKIQIWDTNGVKLKEVSLSGLGITDVEKKFYGVGKLQLIAYNDNEVTDPYYLFNFNETLNRLLGENLLVTVNRGSDFQNFEIVANGRYWWSQSYEPSSSIEPESLMMLFWDNSASYNSVYFIDTLTSYLKVITLFDGDSAFATDTITDGPTIGVRVESSDYYSSSAIMPAKSSILLNTTDGGSRTTGSLVARIYSKGGTVHSVTIADLSTINTASNSGYSSGTHPVSIAFGDYKMYALYNPSLNQTTYSVYNGVGTKLSELMFANQHTYIGFWRTRLNVLLIRTWDGVNNNWYFNDKSKAFVQIPEFYGARAYVRNYSSPTGVDNGTMLLEGQDMASNYYRVLGSNFISNKKATSPGNTNYNNIELGQTYINRFYVDSIGNMYAEVYDYTMTLLKQYSLGPIGVGYVDDYYTSGDQVIYKIQNDTFGTNTWYYVTNESVEKLVNSSALTWQVMVNDSAYNN
jgi:hypothetical protein